MRQLSTWPPEWMGPYGTDRPLPQGEVGVLLRVVASSVNAPYCILEMRWNNQEYVGSLFFDDKESLQRTCDILRAHVGWSISEIGSLDTV